MPVEKRQFTPELYDRWMKSRDEAVAEKDEVISDLPLLRQAAQDESFTGRLRRAVHGASMVLPDLSQRADIELPLIGDFLRGESTLDSPAIDRLVAVLGWPAILAAEPAAREAKRS